MPVEHHATWTLNMLFIAYRFRGPSGRAGLPPADGLAGGGDKMASALPNPSLEASKSFLPISRFHRLMPYPYG